MPMIWIPEAELRALQAVLKTAERVDWKVYDRAKDYIIEARSEPQDEPEPEPVIG